MNNELILGLSICGHDSSAVLLDVKSGEILYALTEERFSNIKHDGGFPTACIKVIEEEINEKKLGVIKYVALNIEKELFLSSIKLILNHSLGSDKSNKILDVIIASIDSIQLFHDDHYPLNYIISELQREEVSENTVKDIADKIINYGNFILRYSNLEHYLKSKFKDATVSSVPHHLCHVASSYYCSGFKESVAITVDGQGETETVTLNEIKDNHISVISRTQYPNSLGSLYMHLTWYLGFDGHPKYPGFTDEFKVMGMSAYGVPKYVDIFRTMGDVNEKGEFHLNFDKYLALKLVEGCRGHNQPVFTEGFYDVFGKRRSPKDPLEQIHYDIAVSFQHFIEEIGVKLAKYLKTEYPSVENICLSGGVALNGLMNMEILKKGGFKNIFIQPASGDDGTALGAALYTKYNILNDANTSSELKNVYLGVEYGDDEILGALDSLGIEYKKPDSIHSEVARLLHEGSIVTRFFGRAEFGPRALGHRSILANPSIPNMKDIINTKIKHREPFRPFAPACLEEKANEYFDIDCKTPYMLLICNGKKSSKLKIPAVIHDDNSARLQTVSKNNNEDFYKIISEFEKLSGIPVLVNTSFNVNGETIVETPLDAIESALFMEVDYLAIGSYLVSLKVNNSKLIKTDRMKFLERRKKRYLSEFFSNELFIWGDNNPIESELEILTKKVAVFQDAAEERLDLINYLDSELKKVRR